MGILLKWTDSMCNYVADCLTETGMIRENEKEIYSYCFGFLADLIFYNISVLLIGGILGNFQLACLYILVMSPTKMLAGGMHAPTPFICDIISYSVSLSVITFTPKIVSQIPPFFLLSAYVICYIFIPILSPVGTKNKRYDKIQKAKLKRYCFLYLSAITLLYLIFFINKMSAYYGIISICTAIILFNQLIAIITNIKEHRHDLENSNV